jgi:transposase
MEELLRSRLIPQGIARRIQSVLLLSKGSSLRRIRECTGLNLRHIVKWRERFRLGGVDALVDRPRPGRPRRVSLGQQKRILSDTLRMRPPGGRSHWSSRLMARRHRVSFDTVQKIWRAAGLKPHRQGTYMASNDPDFAAKAKQVIGLYLQPPQEAAVFCVDEKSAIQALDRLDPVLPLSPGRAERHGFEYYRHGTLSLYAALNTKTGQVLGQTAFRHTSAEFVAFLEQIVASLPEGQPIHIIADNLSAHHTSRVWEFLERNRNVRIHYTPTYSSWFNQVEIWFSKIQRDIIARGIFRSVKDLANKLMTYIRRYNKKAKPFKWTYRSAERRINPVSVFNATPH